MPKKHAPATGEKNAIKGYFSQYEFSASTLIHLMQDNRFDAISVCDPAAGIFYDLVVFSGDKVLAYQIKSEQFPTPFRLRTELISVLVAKTYMWMDGVGYPEKSYKERSGHGHVVMVTNVARKKLEERFGNIDIRTRIIPRHSSSDGKYDCTYFDGALENS